MSEQEIHNICKRYLISNYTINSDGSIDVDVNVNLTGLIKGRIPIQFNKIYGGFYCCDSELTTLEGCPNYVGGSFSCNHNQLTTLEGCPKFVGRNFFCSDNPLESLDGYEGDYNNLICFNKDKLVRKHKRSKKLKQIQNI